MSYHAYIIGAGGVGSWLCPSLCLLVGPKNITVIDGDTLEEKNLNRQLYTKRHIGKNKAQALAKLYGCAGMAGWFNPGMILQRTDWLFVCVDNNPARSAALHACDMYGCRAITAANEVTSSEAYVYCPEWKQTRLDPRVYYPAIDTDRSNDPQARAIGCTGEAQENNRQLVSANFSAAALAQNLFVCWELESEGRSARTFKFLPHKLTSNLTLIQSHACGSMNGLIPVTPAPAEPEPEPVQAFERALAELDRVMP